MNYKIRIGMISLSILLCFLSGCSSWQTTAETEGAVIDFLKVGKADAICIIYKNKTIVIDTGEEEDGAKVLSYLKKQKRSQIDEMIITHFDKDHVGGADIILNGMEVKRVWQPDYKTDKKQYLEYAEVLAKRNINVKNVTEKITLTMEDSILTIYPSGVKESKKDNEHSLVITMKHGNNTFFFAGDAEGKRLKELTEMDFGQFDLLKVPHHGRMDNFFGRFCKRIKPKYAIITSSQENPPDKEVIDLLEKEGTKIYQTVKGTVHCVSTEDGIKIEQE